MESFCVNFGLLVLDWLLCRRLQSFEASSWQSGKVGGKSQKDGWTLPLSGTYFYFKDPVRNWSWKFRGLSNSFPNLFTLGNLLKVLRCGLPTTIPKNNVCGTLAEPNFFLAALRAKKVFKCNIGPCSCVKSRSTLNLVQLIINKGHLMPPTLKKTFQPASGWCSSMLLF